jgi:D-ribulokinase
MADAGVFLGIDVGTGSARAGVFDGTGRLLAAARRPIRIWREPGGLVEQSSEDIWQAVAASVREAVAAAGVAPAAVRGLGFDATCSMVVLDGAGRPLAVGPSEDPARDVIVWMDHRAMADAEAINATGHPVLAYVGGRISPEMQTPKLRWLKRHRPATFAAAGHFLDLSDYLTFRATGATERSVCTVACKWTYLGHERRWDGDYFRTIGLEELADDGFARIGARVVDIGTPLGAGLAAAAAADLGLVAGTPVGASLIDAHSGGVGTVRAGAGELALILGTSACAMAVTAEATFVDGVWGPYFGAMLPGAWLLEGGQSAYGAALDRLVALHPAFPAAEAEARSAGLGVLDLLERRAVEIAGGVDRAALLAGAIHVVPEFLGNRSPEADPHATAVLAGLTLEEDRDSLVRLFVAGLCGLCYDTAAIVAAMAARGVALEAVVVSGGAARSPLLRRILADATGLEVRLPETAEPVLLGGAMVGAVASGALPDLAAAARAMARTAEAIRPAGGEVAAFHARKAEAHGLLRAAERRVRAVMAGSGAG